MREAPDETVSELEVFRDRTVPPVSPLMTVSEKIVG